MERPEERFDPSSLSIGGSAVKRRVVEDLMAASNSFDLLAFLDRSDATLKYGAGFLLSWDEPVFSLEISIGGLPNCCVRRPMSSVGMFGLVSGGIVFSLEKSLLILGMPKN